MIYRSFARRAEAVRGMDDRAAVDDVADRHGLRRGLSNRIEALRCNQTERDERIRDVRVLNDHAQQEVQAKDDMYRTIQGSWGCQAGTRGQ